MTPIRQTQSYLRNLFAKHGISPQRRLGQNFLIDLNIHDLIVDAAEVGPNDVILEVGSGTGALTSLMAARGAVVVAVDVDPAMAKLTAEAVAGLPNVRVLHRDALANKNRLDPEVLDNVRAALAVGSGKQLKLVANLPYHVATPLIVNLLVHPELCPALMVVTIQKELAERICAQAATSAYGAVSVVIQGLADVSIVRSLPPTVFWPRPQVDSAVVAVRPDAAKTGRRRRRRLVSRDRAPAVLPPPQVHPARAGRHLARPVEQGRGRSPGSKPRAQRPAPRRVAQCRRVSVACKSST